MTLLNHGSSLHRTGVPLNYLRRTQDFRPTIKEGFEGMDPGMEFSERERKSLSENSVSAEVPQWGPGPVVWRQKLIEANCKISV